MTSNLFLRRFSPHFPANVTCLIHNAVGLTVRTMTSRPGPILVSRLEHSKGVQCRRLLTFAVVPVPSLPLNHTLLLDQRYRVTEDGTGALLQLDFRGFFAGQTTVVEMYKFDPASSGLDNLMALKVTMTLDAPLLSPLHQRRYYDLEIMSGPSFGHLFFSRRSAGDTVPLCGKGLHHAAR